jgi:hypothetical protein
MFAGICLTRFMYSDTAPVNSFPRTQTSNESVQWVFDISAAGWEVTNVCYYICMNSSLR